jgi:hypothetical protein
LHRGHGNCTEGGREGDASRLGDSSGSVQVEAESAGDMNRILGDCKSEDSLEFAISEKCEKKKSPKRFP